MTTNYRNFWDKEHYAGVPGRTGAAEVMDCRDLVDVCTHLDVALPMPGVLDVGCGTGRWAQFCDGYHGVDVSARAVEYCHQRRLKATLIEGPDDLPVRIGPWVVCFSVFTHIGRKERQKYLAAFRKRADNLLVDILPGHEGGSLAAWYADAATFSSDLLMFGWRIVGTYDRFSPDGALHRYYRCERAS